MPWVMQVKKTHIMEYEGNKYCALCEYVLHLLSILHGIVSLGFKWNVRFFVLTYNKDIKVICSKWKCDL